MRIGTPEFAVLLSASVFATSFVPNTNASLTTSSREVLDGEGPVRPWFWSPRSADPRQNFCFTGPSVGADLYRIYSRAAGEVTAYRHNKTVGLSHMTDVGPQIERNDQWKLKSVSGDVYQIVSKDLGSPVVYDSQNPAAPLVASKNQTLPAEWVIDPVGEGAFLVRLLDEDLYWTANRSSIELGALQDEDGGESQRWRITPLP
ncbi:hypothetical protein DFH09DRAFT_1068563 [Mycena vulgaris]|nr:hypothetical protein DFH09DRAFT_1068563 [Mycena vulgaris]